MRPRKPLSAQLPNTRVLQGLPENARLAVEQIFRCFSNESGLAGMFITGSTARGLAQPDDLDIVAVWDDPITDDRRRSIVAKCRGNRTVDPDTDRFHLYGIVPEFHFMAGKEQVQHMLASFCWRGQLTLENDPERMEGLLASLIDAVPIYDPEALAHQWQKFLTEEYPRQYQARRVHEQYAAACRRLAQLHRNGRGDDPFYCSRIRLEFCEHIVKAIVSLNRRFYWGGKWFQQQLDKLTLKPNDSWPRLCGVLAREPADAAALMKTLAIDTGEIVARRLPEANVDFSLSIVRQIP